MSYQECRTLRTSGRTRLCTDRQVVHWTASHKIRNLCRKCPDNKPWVELQHKERKVSFFKNSWVKKQLKKSSCSGLTAFSLGPPVPQFIVAVQAAGSGVGPQELSQEAVLCWISAHSFPAGVYVGCWVNVSVTGSERVFPQAVAAIQTQESTFHVVKMSHRNVSSRVDESAHRSVTMVLLIEMSGASVYTTPQLEGDKQHEIRTLLLRWVAHKTSPVCLKFFLLKEHQWVRHRGDTRPYLAGLFSGSFSPGTSLESAHKPVQDESEPGNVYDKKLY